MTKFEGILPVNDVQKLIDNIKKIDFIIENAPDSASTYYDAIPEDSYYFNTYFKKCDTHNQCNEWAVSAQFIKQFAIQLEQFLNKHNEIPKSGYSENCSTTEKTDVSPNCYSTFYYLKFQIDTYQMIEGDLFINYLGVATKTFYGKEDELSSINLDVCDKTAKQNEL